jgi:ribonuclease Z
MSFELTILGCNSAVPIFDRFPSSQFLQFNGHHFLIDCGEGSQIQMNKFSVKRSKIDTILISHLHGDHVNGLMGLLGTLALNGRTRELQIIGPAPIEQFVRKNMELMGAIYPYEILIQEIDSTEYREIYSNDELEIYSLPLDHRISTSGYLFKEKLADRNIDPSSIAKFKLTPEEIRLLKNGVDVQRNDGSSVKAEDCLLPPKHLQSYAYVSDTAYNRALIPHLRKVDLLYHEATYLHDMAEVAADRKHTTAKEAAIIASEAEAGQLILGHYSSRYRDLQPFLVEAQSVFKASMLGYEGFRISLPISQAQPW